MSAVSPRPTVPGADPTRLAVADVMHVGVVDCPPQTPMREVARVMAERGIHCVVVDGLARGAHRSEQLVWGIVSDLDLMAAASAEQLDRDAGELAATEPATISAGEDLACAARIMSEHDCSHLIVTDAASRRPVGVISSIDIARALTGVAGASLEASAPTG